MGARAVKKGVVCIDMGQGSMKVLDGIRGLEIQLERLEDGTLSGSTREAVVKKLEEFLKSNWGRTRRTVCAIGARGVSLRRLTLPPASREEFSGLLALQVEREFPLPPEQLAWGYCLAGSGSSGSSGNGAALVQQEVIVAALRREVLEDYLQVLSDCGLRPVFQLGALAASRICPRPAGLHSILDIGHSHSELVSFEDGEPLGMRSLSWGGETITAAIGKALGVDRDEAERIKKAGRGETGIDGLPGEKVEGAFAEALGSLVNLLRDRVTGKLFLVGGTARVPDLDRRLAAALPGDVSCEAVEVKAGEGYSAVTLGLQGDGTRSADDILSFVVRRKKEIALRGPSAGARKWLGAAIILLLTSIALRYGGPFIQLPALEEQLDDVRAERDRFPEIDRELAFLRFLDEGQPHYLNALVALAGAAPPGMILETMSLSRSGEVTLRGTMSSAQQANQFRTKLTSSGFFLSVVIEEQAPTKDKKRVGVRIRARLSSSDHPLPEQADREPREEPDNEKETESEKEDNKDSDDKGDSEDKKENNEREQVEIPVETETEEQPGSELPTSPAVMETPSTLKLPGE